MKNELFFNTNLKGGNNKLIIFYLLFPICIITLYKIKLFPESILFYSIGETPLFLYALIVMLFVSSITILKIIYIALGKVLIKIPSILSIILGSIVLFFEFIYITNDLILVSSFIVICMLIGEDKKFNNPNIIENIFVSGIRAISVFIIYMKYMEPFIDFLI